MLGQRIAELPPASAGPLLELYEELLDAIADRRIRMANEIAMEIADMANEGFDGSYLTSNFIGGGPSCARL